jgi:ribosome maturation factor RimP
LRTTSPFEDKLLALIEPAAGDLGYEIVRIRVMGARRKTLQIMAETRDGRMNSGDCERLSRALSPLLDAEDPMSGEYYLEVSSPGIDRPLTRLQDFDRWAGWQARVELDRMVEGRKRWSGVLAGIEDDNVLLDVEGEEDTALIPFGWIATAKLVLTDELIRESLARRGASEAELDALEQALDEGTAEFASTEDAGADDPADAAGEANDTPETTGTTDTAASGKGD